MARTGSDIRWRTVAIVAAAGALLMLMAWGFVHGHRWLMYLALLGILGAIGAFGDSKSQPPTQPKPDALPKTRPSITLRHTAPRR